MLRNLGRELRADNEGAGQGMLDFSADGDAEARDAMVRARAVLDLAGALGEQLEATGGAELQREVELPLVHVLARMERTGIAADIEQMTSLEADFAAKVREAQDDCYDAIGGEQINLGSPKQLQTVLFDTLGMPKTKKTKTGYTTDADALNDLYTKTEHPFLEALLRHRDASRLRVTVEGLLKSVADDGRIHTTYQQTIAATGRLTSTDPNLQNIPIRTEDGRRIREVFVVGEGYESLMSADYSQIEMRIMAHLSGDEGLIEAFRSGEDLHRFVGVPRVRRASPRTSRTSMRSKVKAMSYGLAYGLSAFGLSSSCISTDEAKGLMDEYFQRFGGVRDYLRDVVAEARTTGYTETMLGRRRYLPDLTSPTTASAARWPSGWPSTPRSRAPPPTSSRSRCSASTAALREAGAALAACCSRCTTSSCSRSRRGSGATSRRWCAARWAAPASSTCRSTSRSASAAPGTTPRTSPVRHWADPETATPARTNDRHGSYADHGVSSATSAVKASPCSILLGNHAPAVDAGCLFT